MVSFLFSSDGAARHRNSAPLLSCHGDHTVVWLNGEQDIAMVSVLIETLARAMSVDDADLVVDLSGVTFMGAAAICELMRGRNTLRLQSRSLTLRSPPGCVSRMLDVCGLADLVESGDPPARLVTDR